MNAATLQAAMPGLPRAKADEYVGFLNAAMREFQVTSIIRSRHALAQVGHESLSLRYFEEIASGAAYEGRKDLGNTQPGDGVRFKGRGPIQITGRTNYTTIGRMLNLDLVGNPPMAANPRHAFRVSFAWWFNAGCNGIADRGAGDDVVVALTRRINGGTNGLADRRSRFAAVGRLGNAILPGAETTIEEEEETSRASGMQYVASNMFPVGFK
jgi:putative chitinase